MDQSERNTEQHLDPIYYTLFLQVHTALAAPFTRHGKLCNYSKPKPFCCAKLANIGVSSSNFTVCRITYPAPLEMLLVAHIKSQEMSDLGSETLICNISEF
jgi:hypothetical protein